MCGRGKSDPAGPDRGWGWGLEVSRRYTRAKLTVQGMFVKYIQAETGARVQIKGMGSGFMEADTGREAEEPMHINVA